MIYDLQETHVRTIIVFVNYAKRTLVQTVLWNVRMKRQKTNRDHVDVLKRIRLRLKFITGFAT